MPSHQPTDAESSPGRPARELLGILLSRVRPHRRALAGILVLTLIGSALSLAQPALVQQVIATIENGQPVGWLVGAVIAVVLVGSLLSALTTYLLPRVGLDVVLTARSDLTGHLLRLPVGVLDSQRIGDLLSRVGADSTLLQTAVTGGVIQLISSAAVSVGALIAMALVDRALLGVVIALVAVAVVVIGRATTRIRRLTAVEQAHLGDLSAASERALGAVRTIKASRAEDRTAADMAQIASRARHAGLRVARVRALLSPALTLTTEGAFLAVLALGGARVASGDLGVGELVAFILYLFLLVMPIAQIAQAVSQVQAGLAALERIDGMLQIDAEDAEDPTDVPDASIGQPRLAVDRVSFSRGDLAVLHDVSFTVPAGTTTALVGPSGAGKTTLLALLERFAEPDTGRILLDGIDLADLPRREVRRRIGYVEQDAPVLAGTLRDNLRLASPDAEDDDLMAVLRAVRLDGLATRTPAGLSAQVGERGLRLSGGERQRLAIARALLDGPDLLLLDEPTANLDARNEQAMSDAIRTAAADHTVVIVAHRLSTVVSADQIVVLEDGRVRATGTHRELIEDDALYRELSTTQLLV